MDRQTLSNLIRERRNFLCVGLDPDPAKMPAHLLDEPHPLFAFNKAIIDATCDHCVGYKVNSAFYEAFGTHGWEQLEMTAAYLPDTHFRIADAKRGDIGNTAARYAEAFLGRLPFDAITVAPYMGEDSVTPFLREGKWVILLALTSNQGAHDFQYHGATEQPLHQAVVRKACQWAGPDQLMFVTGATRAEDLAAIRSLAPDHFLLVPGVGAQGGSLEAVTRAAMTPAVGLLVNSSRQVIHASSGPDFAEAAAQAATAWCQEMEVLLPSIGLH